MRGLCPGIRLLPLGARGGFVPATLIVGAQWGDEGKGKIVDLLAEHSDFVCRYNGGPNAGHTIVIGGETYKVRHIPSGILRGKECVIGAGCVVDPEVLVEELDELATRGVPVDRIHLSANAHVIMPWHVAIDQGGERRGMGIGPARIDEVIGVAKAYVTRVGEGPFPTEIEGPDQERLRELGGEFGTVTGRERRCGWLDIVALRYVVRLNGITSLALTKLDVLSAFAELPVCVRYRLRDGSETDEFPAYQSDFHHCEPIYETLPGWAESLDQVAEVSELPDAAARYIEFVEGELGVEISLIGTGRERERVLAHHGPAALAG